jgi:alkylation response protein AidB-like acyl-CoA dehydrogenase
MVQQLADRRDVDFNLYELFEVEETCKLEPYKDLNKKILNLIVTEARNFSIKEMLPAYADGDRIGPQFDNGEVCMPESFKRVYRLGRENQWTSPSAPEQYGGQGLPHIIAAAIREYLMAANWPLASFLSMGNGTARMIALYGSQEQKATYLENLYTAKWGGTMLLTESDAGTDLGALTTTAVKNPDGTYQLTGNKIFITNGEHDLAENIIHPVLARIEGDPAGTKGISIFIVPKYLVNPDGSLGPRNDIVCTGIEEKHGIHGSATCSMAMGGKGACTGFLLGETCQGMKIMFNMMNGARLSTGAQALAYASHNYLCALDYARQRIQGRDLLDFANPEAPSVPILNHPDVRRNLLWMKAYTEGLRSLIYYSWQLIDLSINAAAPQEREEAADFLELLTPIVKAYGSDRGYEVCYQAMQVFGGAGYTRDYPVEAITRDCKITSIFEGANGIQAMDLLGRKLGHKKGATFMHFMEKVKALIVRARELDELVPLANRLGAGLERLAEVAIKTGQRARSEEIKVAFAHSVPFMEAMGDVVMAWMHLWRAVVALPKIESARKKDKAFYIGQVKTATFFINTILPVTMGKLDVIDAGDATAIDIPDAGYGGL